MKLLTIAFIVTISTLVSAQSVKVCGGAYWDGTSKCEPGYRCAPVMAGLSVCLPAVAAPTRDNVSGPPATRTAADSTSIATHVTA
ncbi:hypothetical protein PIIN_08786 [Serendipita indica DSM 11827]|uniref:Uncharacterized protein n=1 Tax=Serendipita indica (strain DSM 11827) TaxID=1109443 RepID=G4TU24_SERID|nr:hypothetical protein PIIN_08786 [Serendipita indica DSM 11827]